MRYLWLLLLLLPGYALADDTAWQVTPDGLIMKDQAAPSYIDSTYSSQVGKITGITGVHLHEIGEDSCKPTRNGDITKFDVEQCIVRIHGTEYRFAQVTAITPGFAVGESRVFIGYSSTQLVQQATAFTDDQRERIIPIARIQAAKGQLGPGSDISDLGITDLRPITENFEKTLLLWVKNFNGPLVKDGFVVTENATTTRQIDITSGTFSDEELVSHTTGPFTAITGLTLFHTALGNWTSTLNVIRLDNVNYDTVTGLVAMTNNNWYAAHNLMMSPESNGRNPRFAVVYSQAEYRDIGEAEAVAFDFGPFEGATPRWVPLAKIVVKKNTDPVIDIQDSRPLNASGVSSGSLLATTLQGAYNASPDTGIPEITTNDQHNALTIRHGGAGVNPLTLELQLDSERVFFGAYTTHVDVVFSNGSSVVFDNWTGTGDTRFILFDITDGVMRRVSFGADDSCGTGYKCLRTIN